ncbi:MAG TPA: efflux RND transporter periplasmic adaptor subunit [Sphingomonas sp.]
MFTHHPEPLPAVTRLTTRQQVRWIAAVAAGIALLFALLALIHWWDRPVPVAVEKLPAGAFRPTPDELADLKLEPVRFGDAQGGVEATGTIAVDEDHSTPVVLPYSGQIGDVYVQAGQHVVKGQPLLKIASSDFVDARNALFAAAAAHATAVAQLKTAQDNAARQQAIYASAGGALKDARQAQSDLVTAQSALRSTDSALGAARDKLSLLGKSPGEINRLEAVGEVAGIYAQTTFHAPVAGTIATRDVSPGQYVTAGGDKPLLTISDLSHVWLVAQVDQSDAASVHLGDAVDVTTPAYPGRVFHAVIDNIGAALDPATHRLPVRATVANPDEALKPEMFASFSIERHRVGDAILVPASAVIHEGDTARVWVLGKDRLLYAREVTVTDSANGQERIGAGLHEGDYIVTQGAIFVNEAGLGA